MLTWIIVAVAVAALLWLGWYAGKNGWGAVGATIAVAAGMAWEYLGSLFATVQGWF
jgi:hypothetical protein